ncbi:MAG: PAS domain S-box protein [Phycisphaerae bacterium]|nr:PAS domain S-box protein [Phycisphaerae bacterium]
MKKKRASRDGQEQSEAPRSAQRGWEDIFQTIGQPALILDSQYRITAVNRATVKITGKSEEELLGKKCHKIFHGTDRPPKGCPLKKMSISGRSETAEMKVEAIGGTCLVSCTPIADDKGHLQKVIHIATDITERRRAEEALRESEGILRATLESTADGILAVNKKGQVTHANSRFVEMWRIPEAVLQTRDDDKLLSFVLDQLKDPDAFFSRVRQLYQSSREDFDTLEFKDGRVFERFSSPLTQGGVISGRVWSFRDVTERRRAEMELRQHHEHLEDLVQQRTAELTKLNKELQQEIVDRKRAEGALRTSEEKYRALAENMNDIPYSATPAGTVTYIGPQVTRYGLRTEEIISRNFLDFVAPEDRERVGRDFQKTMSTGEEFPTQFRIKDEQDRIHWLEDHGSIRRDESGGFVGITGVLRDITEQRQAEQALHAMNRRLMTAREDERRRLAAELHDSIVQELAVLHWKLKAFSESAEQFFDKETLVAFRQTLKRYGEMIRGIRNISHELFPPTLESLGLAAALREFAKECPAKMRVAVNCSPSIDKARFATDTEIALFRIAQEAVHNAISHSKAKAINLKLKYADGQVQMAISDDGIGFDPAGVEGDGIGLTTMKERASAVGGELKITSRRGQTRLEIRVPAAPQTQE